MIKLLIGGSPCTHWSTSQKIQRETTASGMGWELFKNYLIAKEKFEPDFFLYENNVSAARAIKKQIKSELQVFDEALLQSDNKTRYIEINSNLVSAQNRKRFYVHNGGDIEQPTDRGIMLENILIKRTSATNVDLVPYTLKKIDEIVNRYGYIPTMFNPYNCSEIKEKHPTFLASSGNRQTDSGSVFIIEKT